MKTLSLTIRALSALVWRLETIRARWQCAADHQDANQLGRRNLSPLTQTLTPLKTHA